MKFLYCINFLLFRNRGKFTKVEFFLTHNLRNKPLKIDRFIIICNQTSSNGYFVGNQSEMNIRINLNQFDFKCANPIMDICAIWILKWQ